MGKIEIIVHNGREVSADWPEKIAQAQTEREYRIAGANYARVPYGDEGRACGAGMDLGRLACHDCAVEKGQLHVPGCDVEECPRCCGQAISCPCEDDEDETEH